MSQFMDSEFLSWEPQHTFGVIDVDQGIVVLQNVGQATDEALCAFWRSVHRHQVERSFGSRHRK